MSTYYVTGCLSTTVHVSPPSFIFVVYLYTYILPLILVVLATRSRDEQTRAPPLAPDRKTLPLEIPLNIHDTASKCPRPARLRTRRHREPQKLVRTATVVHNRDLSPASRERNLRILLAIRHTRVHRLAILRLRRSIGIGNNPLPSRLLLRSPLLGPAVRVLWPQMDLLHLLLTLPDLQLPVRVRTEFRIFASRQVSNGHVCVESAF